MSNLVILVVVSKVFFIRTSSHRAAEYIPSSMSLVSYVR